MRFQYLNLVLCTGSCPTTEVKGKRKRTMKEQSKPKTGRLGFSCERSIPLLSHKKGGWSRLRTTHTPYVVESPRSKLTFVDCSGSVDHSHEWFVGQGTPTNSFCKHQRPSVTKRKQENLQLKSERKQGLSALFRLSFSRRSSTLSEVQTRGDAGVQICNWKIWEGKSRVPLNIRAGREVSSNRTPENIPSRNHNGT